ncbi:sodium-independent anion transporter [Porphyromonas sp. HMSC077F02]|uniref:SulP family inorganic anion transporter n=1 Tax=Porphyromonas sp. HMSC077F02 TaxID=1739529 RepID=UPI0008A1D4A4|nr:sulfate permease [Porphyromonas sp. HMSC077F02]OFO54677.1 sodium-independent anion transporter [Porphyromonas sp. HMSC077F02]
MKNRLVPQLFKDLRDYNKETFLKDLTAGIIVGVVALPLAIAFGIASGVSPTEGLITAIIGGFLVSLLGGSKVQIGGPTGAFIVIVFGIIQKHGIDGLALATLMAGVMLVLLGLLRLGSLIKFVPYPIIDGFTAGIAVTIFTTQVKDLFGLQVTDLPGDFIGKWEAYFGAFGTTSWMALLFGIAAIAIIILVPKINKNLPSSLIALIVLTLVSVLLGYLGIARPENIGDRYTIEVGLPNLVMPVVTIERLQQLFPAAFTIAMLGAIESLLSASVADGMIGAKSDSNMELVGQGVANIVVPFFGGIPVTGAIARTMTNINNGGRTPVAGIIHAVVLLLILLVLSPLTSHIPMAVLAGVLVVVSYNMSGWRSFIAIFKGPKGDSLVMVITFLLTVLIDLTVAIGIGMVLAILILLKRVLDASEINLIDDKNRHPESTKLDLPKCIEVYEIEGPFFFGIANRFDETMRNMPGNPRARIIRMRMVPFVDTTAIHNLKTMIELHKESQTQIILSGVQPAVLETLRQSGVVDLLGEENVTPHISLAVERTMEFLKTHYPHDYEQWTKKHEDR